MSRVVLVTGVSRYVGRRLAAQLAADPSIDRVVGVDAAPPSKADLTRLGRTEFVRADIRNPRIARVIAQAKVDTVVHASVTATPRGAGGRTPMKELNVIGTMQLLAACQKSDTVRRLVVKSTTSVYGSSPRDPAVFVEDTHARALPRSGYAKDAVEVEGYVRGFSRRRPDIAVTVLRFANFIGPTIDTPLTRYFGLPVVPTAFGFDPRLQLLHEDDAIEVLRQATMADHHGVFNVAGPGVMLLSQAIRRAGRVARSGARPGRATRGQPGAAQRHGRLLARADGIPQLWPRRRHRAIARAVPLQPEVHDRAGLRHIPPRTAGVPDRRAGPGSAGRAVRRRPGWCRGRSQRSRRKRYTSHDGGRRSWMTPRSSSCEPASRPMTVPRHRRDRGSVARAVRPSRPQASRTGRRRLACGAHRRHVRCRDGSGRSPAGSPS